MAIISILLGFLIVLIALYLIRNEFKKSLDLKISKLGDFSDVEKRKIIEVIEELEEEINNLNRAFYEIVNDLEGKYSIHEKQIELLEKKIKEKNKSKKIIDERSRSNEIKKELINQKQDNKEIKENEYTVKEKVIMMHKKGMKISEIAKKLDIGIGELRLLLNINEKKY